MAKAAIKRKGGRLFLFPNAITQFACGLVEACSASDDDAFEQALAQRCADCCAFSMAALPKEASAKTNIEYICLATLYMIREGVTVKGTVLCKKEESMAGRLPSLNSLTAFGFKKSKYTKAERFLRRAIEEAIFTRPLHKISI